MKGMLITIFTAVLMFNLVPMILSTGECKATEEASTGAVQMNNSSDETVQTPEQEVVVTDKTYPGPSAAGVAVGAGLISASLIGAVIYMKKKDSKPDKM